MSNYHVTAEWDEEAQVWVATSEDVPGLATGADTFEALVEKLKITVPELLEENGLLASKVEHVSIRLNRVCSGSDPSHEASFGSPPTLRGV